MRRQNLLIAARLLAAVASGDRAAVEALLAADVTWQGIKPGWSCAGAGETAEMLLGRADAIADTLPSVALHAEPDRAVLHLPLESVEGRPLPDGVWIVCLTDGDGRISRMTDVLRVRDALTHGRDRLAPGVPEAPLVAAERGVEPRGPGWYVLNVADAHWRDSPHFGLYTRLEGDFRHGDFGLNIGVLAPGQPAALYHREDEQEGFLVLKGECVLLVEGEERTLRQWDFFHSPRWTDHIIVGAGDGPATLLAVGARLTNAVVYPHDPGLAARHPRAVAAETTPHPSVAYEGMLDETAADFDPTWLP